MNKKYVKTLRTVHSNDVNDVFWFLMLEHFLRGFSIMLILLTSSCIKIIINIAQLYETFIYYALVTALQGLHLLNACFGGKNILIKFGSRSTF